MKAVLPVHLYGHPAEMDSIMDIANRYDLVVIEDACQAHGAKYREKKVSSFGAMGCFSFYPTKNLRGYGDGEMVVTDYYTIKTKRREALQAFLKRRGIETLIHYPIPIPLQKVYREFGYQRGDLPLTRQWSQKILSLPFFPEMRESEMEEVAEGIRSWEKQL